MDSSSWSVSRKDNAASRFAKRMQKLLENADFRAETRRNKVAVDLSIAVAQSKLTRQAIADKAGIRLSQLSRQLSGDVNLTLDSIGKICEAISCDYDLILRKSNEKAALQPWQHRLDRTVLVQLVNRPAQHTTQFSSGMSLNHTTCLNTGYQAANDDDEFSDRLAVN
jgi:transcriptional regulator with XRE-family HTH domain